ncbi:MAG: serine/threonine protein kinase [Alphaproteobacteria bacterium]|nr:serine/threonine protein kinase [Alphaproteobacteria bacterium]
MQSPRRYEVLEALGQGGFGTVYRARLLGVEGFSKQVALKVLRPEMASVAEVVTRLKDEARLLALIHHHAIVQVDDLVCLDGRWSVVMEYIDGADLGTCLRLGPAPPRAAVQLVGEVAAALNAARTTLDPAGAPLNLLHRDLKPGNLRLTRHGTVKLLDFGIARGDFDSRESETRSVMFGTPEYMSPERLDFVDHPAGDVYALGVILYETLLARRFGRTHVSPGRHADVLARNLPALREAAPAPVVALVEAMLAFEPEARPDAAEVEQTCDALAASLPGDSLKRWAIERIARLATLQGEAARAEAAHPPDALTGSILIERTPSVALPTPEPERKRRGWVVVFVGLIALGVGVLLMTLMTGSEEPASVVVATPLVEPPTEPPEEPPADPPHETAPIPAPTVAQEAAESKAGRPTRQTESTLPPPAPPPGDANPDKVDVHGNREPLPAEDPEPPPPQARLQLIHANPDVPALTRALLRGEGGPYPVDQPFDPGRYELELTWADGAQARCVLELTEARLYKVQVTHEGKMCRPLR